MLKRAARSILALAGLRVARVSSGVLIERRDRAGKPLIEPKFGASVAERAITDARERWPGHEVVVLTDEYMSDIRLPAARIRCGEDDVKRIAELPID
ncbi:MAG TPA: hypothetical protein VHM24_03530, partial [Gemmatimonadaceae bacterium]|nr:hypothetical protein [Gemmatimonadaceae bacterium]